MGKVTRARGSPQGAADRLRDVSDTHSRSFEEQMVIARLVALGSVFCMKNGHVLKDS